MEGWKDEKKHCSPHNQTGVCNFAFQLVTLILSNPVSASVSVSLPPPPFFIFPPSTFSERASCGPVFPWTHYVAKVGFELLNFLSLPEECLDFSYVPPHLPFRLLSLSRTSWVRKQEASVCPKKLKIHMTIKHPFPQPFGQFILVYLILTSRCWRFASGPQNNGSMGITNAAMPLSHITRGTCCWC